jgi:hypothetical protein
MMLTEEQAIDLCEAFGFEVVIFDKRKPVTYNVVDAQYNDVVVLSNDQFTSMSVLASYLHSHVFNAGIERGKVHLRRDINELLNPRE